MSGFFCEQFINYPKMTQMIEDNKSFPYFPSALLAFDSVPFEIQKPSGTQAFQKRYFSGKSKIFCEKMEIAVNSEGIFSYFFFSQNSHSNLI